MLLSLSLVERGPEMLVFHMSQSTICGFYWFSPLSCGMCTWGRRKSCPDSYRRYKQHFAAAAAALLQTFISKGDGPLHCSPEGEGCLPLAIRQVNEWVQLCWKACLIENRHGNFRKASFKNRKLVCYFSSSHASISRLSLMGFADGLLRYSTDWFWVCAFFKS